MMANFAIMMIALITMVANSYGIQCMNHDTTCDFVKTEEISSEEYGNCTASSPHFCSLCHQDDEGYTPPLDISSVSFIQDNVEVGAINPLLDTFIIIKGTLMNSSITELSNFKSSFESIMICEQKPGHKKNDEECGYADHKADIQFVLDYILSATGQEHHDVTHNEGSCQGEDGALLNYDGDSCTAEVDPENHEVTLKFQLKGPSKWAGVPTTILQGMSSLYPNGYFQVGFMIANGDGTELACIRMTLTIEDTSGS